MFAAALGNLGRLFGWSVPAADGGQDTVMGVVGGILHVAIFVLLIASMWKVFAKAGKPGWAAIIPIYNIIVLLEIVGRPLWWILLLLVPLVNLVVMIMVYIDLAKAFGKGVGFAIGMILLSFIFWPILGFGSARYMGAPNAPAGLGQPSNSTLVRAG